MVRNSAHCSVCTVVCVVCLQLFGTQFRLLAAHSEVTSPRFSRGAIDGRFATFAR